MIDYNKFIINSKKLSILLVEDYKPLRDEIVEILDEFFPIVKVASNGQEALSIYKEYIDIGISFDIVISDIEMPIKNGVELSEDIYKINQEQHIIILSSHTDRDYLLKFINLGISKFITKPIDYEMFMDVLYDISSKISSLKGDSVATKTMVALSDDYIWDKEGSVLKKGNQVIHLTRSEILLMKIMFIRENKLCTNEDIINYFYAEDIYINESSIRNLVFKLRKKIPNGIVKTVYGMGYKLKLLS